LNKSLVVTNTGSVAYERLNSCGYHPANENLFCDVEVRRRTGYIGFPAGSQEYVLFCYDCDRNGSFDYQTLGSVHVTDDISGGPLSFYFNASSSTLPASSTLCTANNGQAGNVRAILSWFVAPTSCTFTPIWGNQVDFTVRRDP